MSVDNGVTAGTDAVVVLEDVRKQFGDYVAVEHADFAIRRGEFFSLLGPSGCGKTTILKMIAGFEQPTAGAVLLEGVDVSSVAPHKRNVNTVFQQYALFPHMSIVDNVAFGLRSKKVAAGEARKRSMEMLDVVRLAAADYEPGALGVHASPSLFGGWTAIVVGTLMRPTTRSWRTPTRWRRIRRRA